MFGFLAGWMELPYMAEMEEAGAGVWGKLQSWLWIQEIQVAP